MDGYILGVDLGTSSMKCVVYDTELSCAASCRRAYSAADRPLRCEDWWSAFLLALEDLSAQIKLTDICCVSFSGYNALVGVDRGLNGKTPVIVYRDARPARHMESLSNRADFDYIFSRTGNRLHANGVMANAIRYLQDSGQARDVCMYLYSNGYLAAQLTGEHTIDASRASLSLLHDPREAAELSWDPDLLDFFGIRPEQLPRILQGSALAGHVTRQAAALTGLRAGTPVLAGAMDSMCAALGSGVVGAGQMLDIGGSAGGLAAVSDRPLPHERFYLVRTALPGHWCSIGPLDMSGSLFTWYVKNFLPGSSVDAYFEKMETLPPLSSQVYFLPYVGSARHPYWTPDAGGHFLNLRPENGIDDLSRAVMDGLACAYRRIYEDLCAAGMRPREIVAAGGDSKSGAWVRTKASFLGVPYRLSSVKEASAKGCILLAARALGLAENSATAAQSIAEDTIVCPDEKLWEKTCKYYMTFQKYCDMLY